MKKILIISLISFAVMLNTAWGQYDHERRYNLDQIFFNSAFEKDVVINYLEGNKKDYLELLLAPGEKITRQKVEEYKSEFYDFIDKLNKKRMKTNREDKFLEYLFFKVHRKYLKHYHNYVTVDKLFEKKYYDCVVGSGFYALVLDELGINYHIVETNYHMFVMLQLNGNSYLLESTDPLNGFVSGNKSVMERLKEIKNHQLKIERENSNSSIFTYKYVIHKDIDLSKLVGLQYFNQATIAYNQYKFDEAINCVQKGRLFYDSSRMKEMMRLIVNAYQTVEAKNNKE